MSKRFLFTIFTILVIVIAAGVTVYWAKGYTFSSSQKGLVGTGIISVTSIPDSASVFVDGHLTTATNATVSSLLPKEYTVRVVKEGFIPWERKVKVREGLVTELKLTLFPAIPTIYPLTFTGVKNPILSPDNTKLAYIVPTGSAGGGVNKKAGVWVWTFEENRPLAFARGAQPHQIAQTGTIDYTNTTLRFSPDSKQVLASIGTNNYLLNDESINSEPKDITPVLQSTLKAWDDDLKSTSALIIEKIKDSKAKKIASSAAILKWSPDESKFLYKEKPLSDKEKDGLILFKDYKVYDLEDKIQYNLPEARVFSWLPDSKHVVLVEEDKVSIVDFDGSNKAVIYAGKFEDSFVFAWPDASRLVVVSSLPTPTASEPNLFGINIK